MLVVTTWLQYRLYRTYNLLDLCCQSLQGIANPTGRPAGGTKFLPEAFGSLEPMGGPLVTENYALTTSYLTVFTGDIFAARSEAWRTNSKL
jgi:hypothetical protein